jgi:hypothetical protein
MILLSYYNNKSKEMERLALSSKSFYDPDILDKKREIEQLKKKIQKLENKVGPRKIYVKSELDYRKKIENLNNSLNNEVQNFVPINVHGWNDVLGYYLLNALITCFKNFSISKYDKDDSWAIKTANSLYRNMRSFINSLAMNNFNGWVEFYDENINRLSDIILNFIDKAMWDCEGTGILQEWSDGIVLVIMTKQE